MKTVEVEKRRQRIKEYDRLIRRLRNDPRLWDDDDRVYHILGKALERRAELRKHTPNLKVVGPYSGLTRRELQQSGTCETDWF
jgi:hypothetical protein